MKKNCIRWGIAYGIVLMAFTVYLLLDTFVITRTYSMAESDSQEEYAAAEAAPLSLVGISHEYDDGEIAITVTAYRGFDSDIYAAEVQLSSPSQLKTALAKDAYGKNIKEQPSVMAERNRAILAVNGDYYGAQERGYVLRNGVIYRTARSKGREDLVVWGDGTFGVVHEQDVSLQSLLEDGAVQVLSFGPALVENGAASVQQSDLRGKDKTRNPRTAIGHMGGLRYLFVVADGRTESSDGLTIPELAEVMEYLGAETAYNLDGGGSSCMIFDGEIVNHPTATGSSTREREVSDIVCIGY